MTTDLRDRLAAQRFFWLDDTYLDELTSVVRAEADRAVQAARFVIEWDDRPEEHDHGTRLEGPFPSREEADAHGHARAGAAGGSWSWTVAEMLRPTTAAVRGE